MSDNYVDFNTFLVENVFPIGNIVTSNLNASASEFVPRNNIDSQTSRVVSIEKPLSTRQQFNYGNRKSKANVSNNRCYNHNHRSSRRNDFWSKNRENATVAPVYDKNVDLKVFF